MLVWGCFFVVVVCLLLFFLVVVVFAVLNVFGLSLSVCMSNKPLRVHLYL